MSKSATERILKNGGRVNNQFKNGFFFSVKNNFQEMHYRSSYELKAYILLENNDDILSYQVEPFRIKYQYKGTKRYTVPDILITYVDTNVQTLVEIKPKHQLKDKRVQAKMLACDLYAKENNMVFECWTEEHLGIQ